MELQLLGGAGEGPEAAGAALQALTYYNRPARVAYLRELVQALLDGKNEACHPLDIKSILKLHSLLHAACVRTTLVDPGTCMVIGLMACEAGPIHMGAFGQHCAVPHALI